MENYKGRYIKVLQNNLGGDTDKYKIGDFLKVLEDKLGNCIIVEHAGTLNVRGMVNRVEIKDIEIMPLDFTPEFVLPEKWSIRLTKENYEILGEWRTDGPLPNIENYIKGGFWLHTPMFDKQGYNVCGKYPEYTEITWKQFEEYVLFKKPVLKEFPEIGCCQTIDINFIKFLRKRFGITDSKTKNVGSTGVGWNKNSYWYLVNVNHSSKPHYTIDQLKHFYTKNESYCDYIERVTKEQKQLIYKKVDYENPGKRSESIFRKICGSNIKIREADSIRGVSLRGSKSKIRIRSNNSYY